MVLKANIAVDYVVDEDASVTFESPKPIDLALPLAALSFQFAWDASVVGTVTFYASIYPDPYKWEKLVNCGCIEFDTADSETQTELVALTGIWLTTGFIKFIFVPADGSIGFMSVAARIVPV